MRSTPLVGTYQELRLDRARCQRLWRLLHKAGYIVRDEDTAMRGIDVNPVPRAGEMAMTVHFACIALTGACVAFNQIVGFTVAGRELRTLADEFDALKASTGIG